MTHSALFDVTNSRTKAFVLAYGEITDLRSLYGTVPEDTDLVAEYAAKVRETEMVWKDAFHHAEQLGYTWLEAEQAAKARRSEALLRTAANPAASEAERQLAAAKATELLGDIRGLRLPTQVVAAVAASARGALPAAARP